MPEVIKVFGPAREKNGVRIAAALQNFGDNPNLSKVKVSAVAEEARAGGGHLAKPPTLGGIRKSKDTVVGIRTTSSWEHALKKAQHWRDASLDRAMRKRIVRLYR